MWCNRDLVPENAAWKRAQLRRRIEWQEKLLDDEARQAAVDGFEVAAGPGAMPGQEIDVQTPVVAPSLQAAWGPASTVEQSVKVVDSDDLPQQSQGQNDATEPQAVGLERQLGPEPELQLEAAQVAPQQPEAMIGSSIEVGSE